MPRLTLITLTPFLLLLIACDKNTNAHPISPRIPPPESIQSDFASATILITGEGFPENGTEIILPGTESTTTSKFLNIQSPLPHRDTNTISILSLSFGQSASIHSVFLAITDPLHPHGKSSPQWGIWIRATGPVMEEGQFPCETGTRLVIDGTPYTPIPTPNPLDSPAGPTVNATFTIDEIRNDHWQGTLTGTFAPPSGSPHIKVHAKLKIPPPSNPPNNASSRNTPP